MKSCILYLVIILLSTIGTELKANGHRLQSCDIESLTLLGPNHKTKELLVSLCSDNFNFVESLAQIMDDINRKRLNEEDKVKLRIVNAKQPTLCSIASNSLCEAQDELRSGADPWMRDFCKVVSAKIKGEKDEKIVLFDTNRERGTKQLVENLSKIWGDHLVVSAGNSPNCGDYGGNIDVTPNNILYIGNQSSPAMVNFWQEKGYKDNLVILDTSWLTVGHVDEFITTVIRPNDPCGMAIVKADPVLALKSLIKDHYQEEAELAEQSRMTWDMTNDFQALSSFINTNQTLVKSREQSKNVAPIILPSVDTILPDEKNGHTLLRQQFSAASFIENNVQLLKEKIAKKTPACEKIEVVSIPVLFKCNEFEAKEYCGSILPNSVNFANLGQDLIVPDPLYAPFREITQAALAKVDQQSYFIEDLSYHIANGEVHCGTNDLKSKQQTITY
ncbi:MAG: hypothetical protein HQK50_00325 [Oligoflexia bacterium]|nr:hypothetical protein [Oligoflexia bacterium]